MAITEGPHPKIMFRTDYLFHLSHRSGLFSELIQFHPISCSRRHFKRRRQVSCCKSTVNNRIIELWRVSPSISWEICSDCHGSELLLCHIVERRKLGTTSSLIYIWRQGACENEDSRAFRFALEQLHWMSSSLHCDPHYTLPTDHRPPYLLTTLIPFAPLGYKMIPTRFLLTPGHSN